MLVDVVRLDLHTLYYMELTEQLTLVRVGVYFSVADTGLCSGGFRLGGNSREVRAKKKLRATPTFR